MPVKIKYILDFLEKEFSDLSRQYEWDNSNRQIILENDNISRVGLSLDPTKQAIEEAIDRGCELLITHHPLFFGGIKKLIHKDPLSDKIVLAIKHNLNIVSYHTNFDIADYSLNDYLVHKLGAEVEGIFIEEGSIQYYKFVVFVPTGYEQKLIDVIDASSAGSIGNYKKCTFFTQGIGTFEPGEGTDPFIGKKGELEEVKELKLETIVHQKDLKRLIENVIKIHPYEEVAYDVYPLKLDLSYYGSNGSYGLGRIGKFQNRVDLETFINIVSEKLSVKDIRYNFLDKTLTFDRFAVVTGSGASTWKSCYQKDIKVLLTGDLKHHDALDAKEGGIVIIDAGHFHTERVFLEYLKEVLEKKFNIEAFILNEDESIKNWRR